MTNRPVSRISPMKLIAMLMAAVLVGACGGEDEPELPAEGTLAQSCRSPKTPQTAASARRE